MHTRVVIIPALNPDEKLLALLESLKSIGLCRMIVVNDGSVPECRPLFDQAAALGAVILEHKQNQGKGRALKTAFSYALETYGEEVRAVCADADGQHSPEDILACLERLEAYPEALVMGCRSFDDTSIPLRSRFGNKVTRAVFRLLCGIRVSDTQTGLRALTGETMRKFLGTRGERFEYEMNVLIDTREKGVPIEEVPISTIYLEENRTSHFHPLRDSLRIYTVFSKFILVSLVSFLTDILLFWIFIWALEKTALDTSLAILFSTAGARLCSSLLNYALNRKKVFQGGRHNRSSLARYYILCALQMLCSAGIVSLLVWLTHGSKVLLKLAVDLLLFVISFQIQREWVFAPEKNRENGT